MPPSSDPFVELRAWVTTHCGLGDPVRNEAYRCALAAICHRVLKFGFEPVLNQFTARDCMNCVLMCGGEMAEMFMRIAFTRAIVEDDGEVLQRLLQSPYIPESRYWFTRLIHCVRGNEAALLEGADWLAGMRGEELSVASLTLGRIHPHLVEADWLVYADGNYPRLCAEICLLMLRQPKYETVVKTYLRDHPEVRYAVDDARWPISM